MKANDQYFSPAIVRWLRMYHGRHLMDAANSSFHLPFPSSRHLSDPLHLPFGLAAVFNGKITFYTSARRLCNRLCIHFHSTRTKSGISAFCDATNLSPNMWALGGPLDRFLSKLNRCFVVLCLFASFFVFVFCLFQTCMLSLFWLLVPVQSIAWEDSSPKWPIMAGLH